MKDSVLVVGAGPTGMTMASELKRYGVSVRIVDKAAQRTDKSKALVLWSRTLELLNRGAGAAPFIEAGFKVNAVNFMASADNKVIGHVSMNSVKSPYPYALMIPQSETERLLEERLAAQGVMVERQTEVLNFKEVADGVEVTLRHADGREETTSAGWLIGCDGAHSIVRRTLGATFDGETNNSDWMLADVHMRGYPYPDTEASVYWHHEGVFVVFPISPGRYRVLADLPATGAAQPAAPTLEEAQAVIARRGPKGLTAFDPIWLAGFRINGRKVKNYRWGRAFLVGDAAHIHSPAGGQGMNTGMQDAFNLAWKLALVIRNRCNEKLLDSYSVERSHVGDEVLKSAGRLTTVGTLRNPITQAVRNLVAHVALGFSSVQHAFADNMTEMDVAYPETPLNGPHLSGGPKPGERLAPAAGEKPVGSGDTPLFGLFADDDAGTSALVHEFKGVLDPTIRPPVHKGGICLVRPDGYVACSADNPKAIAAYLSGIAMPSA